MAVSEAQRDPGWPAAMSAAIAAGVSAADPTAVLAHALGAGNLLTAQARHEADEAAAKAALDAAAVNASISARQFWTGLVQRGLITEAEALAAVARTALPAALELLIAGLPSNQQFATRMKLLGATEFIRSDPTVAVLAAAEGWSAADIDAFWALCRTL